MRVHLTPKSSNAKTGPMPVSTTTKDSCPDACSLKGNGCYAESGPLGIHWSMVTNGARGYSWAEFCADISELPDGTIWRHNQAGDLPSSDNVNIDAVALGELVAANYGRKGFTYTHYDPMIGQNAHWIKASNAWGFTINLSAESLEHADQLADMDIGPVCTILPEGSAPVSYTPKGRKVIVCPAQQRDDVSCYTCRLCQRQDRPIIGFIVHGSGKKKAARVFTLKQI